MLQHLGIELVFLLGLAAAWLLRPWPTAFVAAVVVTLALTSALVIRRARGKRLKAGEVMFLAATALIICGVALVARRMLAG